MFAREDILERLLEPYATLTPEEIAAAESFAVRDIEVAEALRLCRAMAGLTDAAIFGEPRTSDAVFLIALREKVSPSMEAVFRPAFGSRRMLAMVSAVCAVLFVLILSGNRFATTYAVYDEESLASVATVLESPLVLEYSSLAQATADPDSLASYLGISDMAAHWDFAEESGVPATDALLELDPQTIEEVLNRLENENFF